MKKLFPLLCAMTLVLGGCYDDTDVWNYINSLDQRVTSLEELCRQMNTNISSLQTVVDALKNNDYVTSVVPITEGGKTIGYTINNRCLERSTKIVYIFICQWLLRFVQECTCSCFYATKRKVATWFVTQRTWKTKCLWVSLLCTFINNWATWISQSQHLSYFTA